MGRLCGKNGRWKTGKESIYPESGRKIRKTKLVMGGMH